MSSFKFFQMLLDLGRQYLWSWHEQQSGWRALPWRPDTRQIQGRLHNSCTVSLSHRGLQTNKKIKIKTGKLAEGLTPRACVLPHPQRPLKTLSCTWSDITSPHSPTFRYYITKRKSQLLEAELLWVALWRWITIANVLNTLHPLPSSFPHFALVPQQSCGIIFFFFF